ncbi:MAG: hypothetical protein HY820_32690 [Acidobacteria bacterium]|nr:hypothetical protein [Acidobacteriota bacterium]
MQPTVKAQFRAFNEPLEGAIPFMYQDIKGLITVGVGNLIDPAELAMELPFRWKQRPDLAKAGNRATRAEIRSEWNRIKGDTTLAAKGHRACEPLTNLELSNEAIDDLIAGRLADNETKLKAQRPFKDFDNWPADAQLGLLSMAWAMGPNAFTAFKKFSAGCAKQDFDIAAAECKMNDEKNPGLVPRNKANLTLFCDSDSGEGRSASLRQRLRPTGLKTAMRW